MNDPVMGNRIDGHRSGVSQTVAMSISGHRTDAMFRRYNITSDADQRAALTVRQAYSAQQIASEPGVNTGTEKVRVQRTRIVCA